MNLRLAFLVSAFSVSPVCLAQVAGNLAADDMLAEPAYKTGSYTEHTTLVSLVGEEGVRSFADILDANHVFEFDVYVPESYDLSAPAGLLVYVSPIDSGGIPDTWKEVFDRRNLIWVSVNNSGNTMPPERRIAKAKVSPAFILQNYEIDPQRTYISGMLGGGKYQVSSPPSILIYSEVGFSSVASILGRKETPIPGRKTRLRISIKSKKTDTFS
jgi:hypothetical protein